MSTYAIGDIQGCYAELQQLLILINFNIKEDVLWCTGDLVNRGPQSLSVLRFFKQLNERAIVVLGNHDLHLLAVANGHDEYLKPKDTLTEILQAPDREELLLWLRQRPLLHRNVQLGFSLVHAGLPPQWDITTALHCAQELQAMLQSESYEKFLHSMYGNKPKNWSPQLTGWKRLRYITNCFTRLRYCNEQGKLALEKKDSPKKTMSKIDKKKPWFLHENRASQEEQIIFGHWSTLGLYMENNVYCLDTGCLWGGTLTALRLEDKQIFRLPCKGECVPGEIDK